MSENDNIFPFTPLEPAIPIESDSKSLDNSNDFSTEDNLDNSSDINDPDVSNDQNNFEKPDNSEESDDSNNSDDFEESEDSEEEFPPVIEPEPEEPNEEEESKPTPTSFFEMYSFFLAGITDDMFMELTKEDTEEMLLEILMAAFPHFEFPHWENAFELDLENDCFSTKLTSEEMMILRQYMISEWIGFQLATVDLVRQKYSGSDFKFTSQASHLKQLTTLKKEYETKGFHLQRLYCRRRMDKEGLFVSTFDTLALERPIWTTREITKW